MASSLIWMSVPLVLLVSFGMRGISPFGQKLPSEESGLRRPAVLKDVRENGEEPPPTDDQLGYQGCGPIVCPWSGKR